MNEKFRDFSHNNRVMFSNMLHDEPRNELLDEDVNLTTNKFLDKMDKFYNCFSIKLKFISLKHLNSP